MPRNHCWFPSSSPPVIVEMTLDDLEEVLDIEQRSFSTPWSKSLFLKEIHSRFSKIFVARNDYLERSRVRGYISLWFVDDEVHVLNLAVHPAFRRKGIATVLLTHSLSFARHRGITRAFLDVRQSNYQAISLYKKHGFRPIGIRERYYSDTGDDAIVMALEME